MFGGMRRRARGGPKVSATGAPLYAAAVLAGGVALLGAGVTRADVVSEVVTYRHDEVTLEGYVAHDAAFEGPRPAVLIVHAWKGHEAYVRRRADQLAGLGYVALALDMYGQGVRADTRAEAAALAGRFKSDRALMRARARAGLDVLRAHPLADVARTAAIGYCFGGTVVLELARAGAPLAGIVSFHGGLERPHPADAKHITGKVLVLHGADDPHVPPAEVEAFQQEMRAAGVDWQLIAYGGAVHAFTDAGAGTDPARGAAYDARADRRSWQAMRTFFSELFE